MPNDTPFPTAPQDISAPWLESVLNAPVSKVHVERIGEDSGFAGSVFRVRPEYPSPDAALPNSLVWKTASPHPDTHKFLAAAGAYEAESAFYRNLASDLQAAPRPFFSALDPETQAPSILTEDLSHMTPGDQIAGCTLEQAAAIVSETARLNAQFWGDSENQCPAWVKLFDADAAFFKRLHSVGWRKVRADAENPARINLPVLWLLISAPMRFRAYRSAIRDMIDTADRVTPHILTIKSRLAHPPITLLHGDLRLDNIFFAPNHDLKLIDWQAIRAGRGAYDLAYFLSTSIPAQDRRRWQPELMESYVQTLSDNGVTGYTIADCAEDLRWALLDLVTFMGVLAAILEIKDTRRSLELRAEILYRLQTAIQDNSALDLLE